MFARAGFIVASIVVSASAISYNALDHKSTPSKVVKSNAANVKEPQPKAFQPSASAPVRVIEDAVPVVEIVPVPVMQVVVVEGGGLDDGFKGDGFENAGQPAEFAPEPQQHSIDKACRKEMIELQSNNTQVMKAQRCEDDDKTMEKVISALQTAKLEEALGLAAATFEKCSAISAGCAKQLAPSTVQKLRLSGMAVTEKCAAAVQNSKADTGGACMKNMTSKTVEALQLHDLDLALLRAQHGLDSCMEVLKPCDFQFAPMVTIEIAQIVMQQAVQKEMMQEAQAAEKVPVVEVLLNGLKKMKQVSSNMTAAEEKKRKASEAAMTTEAKRTGQEVQDIMNDVEGRTEQLEHHFQKVEERTALRKKQVKESAKVHAKPVIVTQKKKALSLLSLQDGLTLSFRSHTVAH